MTMFVRCLEKLIGGYSGMMEKKVEEGGCGTAKKWERK